jgi:hypothetical protein
MLFMTDPIGQNKNETGMRPQLANTLKRTQARKGYLNNGSSDGAALRICCFEFHRDRTATTFRDNVSYHSDRARSINESTAREDALRTLGHRSFRMTSKSS